MKAEKKVVKRKEIVFDAEYEKRLRRQRIFSKIEPLLYLLPALVFFILFIYYPFAKTVVGSFFTVDSFGRFKSFAGLRNYVHVLKDPRFHKVFWNTIIYTILFCSSEYSNIPYTGNHRK